MNESCGWLRSTFMHLHGFCLRNRANSPFLKYLVGAMEDAHDKKGLTSVSPYRTNMGGFLVAHLGYGAGVLAGEGDAPAHGGSINISVAAIGDLGEGFCRQRFERLLACVLRVLHFHDNYG